MIVYASRTGNVEYIISKLGLPSIKITKGMIVSKPYVLFTYTDKLGDIPDAVNDFLNDNSELIKGVICSGNSNFGVNNFCRPADIISKQFSVPILRKVELRGFEEDYLQITNKYKEIMEGCN